MKATWEQQKKLTILSAKVAEIAYPVDADYKDESKEIISVVLNNAEQKVTWFLLTRINP